MNDITNLLSENIHYDIIPADNDEHGWHIRINEVFPETVIAFGAIEYVGEDENDEDGQLSFNFAIVSSPDPDLTTEDLTFQEYCGRILNSILDKAISDGTLMARDNKTGEILASEDTIEDMKEIYDEYQSGTDDTEEPTDQ